MAVTAYVRHPSCKGWLVDVAEAIMRVMTTLSRPGGGAMETDERLPTTPGGVTSGRPARRRLSFWLRPLMALPVIAAALIVAYMAVDRLTAVPWSSPMQGDPVTFKVQDAATGQPVVGARVRMVNGGSAVLDVLTSTLGDVSLFGGDIRVSGYRSLVRDTRRVDLGDTSLLVTADGYEDFAVSASDGPLFAHPAPDGESLEYVIRLRRDDHAG